MQAIASQEIRTPENWCGMIKAALTTCGGNQNLHRLQPLPVLPGPALTACGAERGSVCGRDGGAGVGCGR
ncbi:hypothetical protein SAMN02910435_00006 [Ruminococcaceae bacterium D5]|nr:hypothetical protein SAMN02910435_00006 [Ruminococcaceae bacterium D5]